MTDDLRLTTEAEVDNQAAAARAVDLDAIRRGREVAAQAILDHADKHAPKDGNDAQRRLRRHLHTAARVAAGPVTVVEAAAAFAAAMSDAEAEAGREPLIDMLSANVDSLDAEVAREAGLRAYAENCAAEYAAEIARLRADVSHLTAERDAAFEMRNEAMAALKDVRRRLIDAEARALLCCEKNRPALDAAEAELSRLRPVVEAAKAYVERMRGPDALTLNLHQERMALYFAVDILTTSEPEANGAEI